MGIFDKRIAFKPFEYPDILEYKNAINHSYWLHCVGKEDRVCTQNGLIKVKDLYDNGNPLQLFNNEQVVLSSPMQKTGHRLLCIIHTKEGYTHTVTPDHRVMTPDGWVEAHHLKTNDLICIQTTKGLFGSTHAPERAYLQGHFQGDGTRKKNAFVWQVWAHEYDMIPELEQCLKHVYQEHKLRGKVPTFCKEYFCNGSTVGTRQMWSKRVDGIFSEKNIIPEFVWQGDEITVWSYLKGLFYTDGSVSQNRKHQSISLAQIDLDFLKQIQLLLLNLGIKSSILIRESCERELPCGKNATKTYKCKACGFLRIDHHQSVKLIEENINFFSRKGKNFRYSFNPNKSHPNVYARFKCLETIGEDDVFCVNVQNKNHAWICNGFITHNTEWNFISDIHDFNVKLNDKEKNILKNALLAISQIEVSVKRFWTKLGERFPKAEFEQVGVTFGESEVRHADAYSHLLQVLNLNDDFNSLMENPVIQGRVDYLTKYLKGAADNSNENYTLTLTLFALFIENVSLFSQFAIIKSFNQYKNILKDVDNVVQATQKEECYVEDTEVLTPDGWKLMIDMNIGDEVIQYNDGDLEITRVQNVTKRQHSGDVYHFHKNKHQCVVTPNHDMIYYDLKGNLRKVTAEAFKPESKKKMPHGGLFNNIGIESLSFEDRLRIAIQADGTVLKWSNVYGEILPIGKDGGYNYSVRLIKPRKISRMKWILHNLGLDHKIEIFEDGSVNFKIRYNLNYDYKEFDWINIRDKSINWCNEFVEECIEWDGYKTGFENSFGYSSTNKRAIDKVQLVAILAGYRTTIRSIDDKRKDGYKTCYKLTLLKKDLITRCHALKKQRKHYEGTVCCITVPSGVIVTRYQNDLMIAGNCIHAMFGVCIIQHIKEEYPEWFDKSFYEKIYRASKKAFDAESKILDWIFEDGELEFLSKDVISEFIKHRFNESLEMIGGEKIFEVDNDKLQKIKWFVDELYAEVNTDFFHKKPVTYSKKVQAIKAEDLF